MRLLDRGVKQGRGPRDSIVPDSRCRVSLQDHPNIVRFQESFEADHLKLLSLPSTAANRQDHRLLQLVLELCEGGPRICFNGGEICHTRFDAGELIDRVTAQGSITERQAAGGGKASPLHWHLSGEATRIGLASNRMCARYAPSHQLLAYAPIPAQTRRRSKCHHILVPRNNIMHRARSSNAAVTFQHFFAWLTCEDLKPENFLLATKEEAFGSRPPRVFPCSLCRRDRQVIAEADRLRPGKARAQDEMTAPLSHPIVYTMLQVEKE